MPQYLFLIIPAMSEPLLIAGRYALGKPLGKGSFGEIFLASCSTGQYAIKREALHTSHSSLPNEARVLQDLQGLLGIPKLYWSGSQGEHYYLVMDLLGHSLEELFKSSGKKGALRTTVQMGLQVLERLESIHSRGYLHRDVKPANCLMGLKDDVSVLYLIDFGLSKRYMEIKTKTHIIYREGKPMTGTARYASINTHLGIEQGRRDDLESLFYMILYLLAGKLPWQGVVRGHQHDKGYIIGQLKISVSPHILCQAAPPEFAQMFTYIRQLKFEQKPDYSYLRDLLNRAAQREVLRPSALRSRRAQSLIPSVRIRETNREHARPSVLIASETVAVRVEDSQSTLKQTCKGPDLSARARVEIARLHSAEKTPALLCTIH